MRTIGDESKVAKVCEISISYTFAGQMVRRTELGAFEVPLVVEATNDSRLSLPKLQRNRPGGPEAFGVKRTFGIPRPPVTGSVLSFIEAVVEASCQRGEGLVAVLYES